MHEYLIFHERLRVSSTLGMPCGSYFVLSQMAYFSSCCPIYPGASLISSDIGGITVHGSVRPLVALILTKNCLNWVKLSVKGRICCNLVATECNSDFACCGTGQV